VGVGKVRADWLGDGGGLVWFVLVIGGGVGVV
jgi:hypothetical protein